MSIFSAPSFYAPVDRGFYDQGFTALPQSKFTFGINLNQTPKFNREKNKFKPTSISDELGIKPSIHPLTAMIIKTIIKSYHNCVNEIINPNFLSDWNKYDYLINKDISVLKGNDLTKGNCQGIDHDGNLLLKFPNGSK